MLCQNEFYNITDFETQYMILKIALEHNIEIPEYISACKSYTGDMREFLRSHFKNKGIMPISYHLPSVNINFTGQQFDNIWAEMNQFSITINIPDESESEGALLELQYCSIESISVLLLSSAQTLGLGIRLAISAKTIQLNFHTERDLYEFSKDIMEHTKFKMSKCISELRLHNEKSNVKARRISLLKSTLFRYMYLEFIDKTSKTNSRQLEHIWRKIIKRIQKRAGRYCEVNNNYIERALKLRLHSSRDYQGINGFFI